MEGFELLSTGAWSILPPLLALGLALITKEVYSSLLVGVFSGLIIYEFCLEGVGFDQLITAFTLIPQVMAEQISSNAALILFLALLGALVVIIAIAGGSRAYAEWAAKHIKSARMATVMTALLGIVVFVDDYFNCLTVGAVMRPVTDKFRISHEKLAWIIDSTAAPVCIIAPVSSWAVAMGGYMGENGFNTFVASIPYNLYALVTIVFVFAMCGFGKDFFSMGKAQRDCDAHTYSPIPPHASALETVSKAGVPSNPEAVETVITEQSDLEGATKAVEQFKGLDVSPNGKVFDLVIPIVVLIVFSITGMLYVGGFFEGVDFITAFADCNASAGLVLGSSIALLFTFVFYRVRSVMTFQDFAACIPEGFKAMVSPMLILSLAWTLSGMTGLLGAKYYVANLLGSSAAALQYLLPFIIFLVAVFLAFATGTSWGTFSILIPIVCQAFPDGEMLVVSIAACLSGAVCGDHCSPISDTTIMASAGAHCSHVNHVSTQLPYAITAAACSAVCYIITGLAQAVLGSRASLVTSLVLLVVAIVLELAVLSVIRARTRAKTSGDAV